MTFSIFNSIGKAIQIGLVSILGVVCLSACDDLNISIGRGDDDEADEGLVLIEVDESDIRPELDRDVSGQSLPLPGATRPLATAPDVREVEQQMFEPLAVPGATATTYSVTFSPVELDMLNRTGARAANNAIRGALTPAPGIQPTSQPINYSAELDMLRRAGVRSSRR